MLEGCANINYNQVIVKTTFERVLCRACKKYLKGLNPKTEV